MGYMNITGTHKYFWGSKICRTDWFFFFFLQNGNRSAVSNTNIPPPPTRQKETGQQSSWFLIACIVDFQLAASHPVKNNHCGPLL